MTPKGVSIQTARVGKTGGAVSKPDLKNELGLMKDALSDAALELVPAVVNWIAYGVTIGSLYEGSAGPGSMNWIPESCEGACNHRSVCHSRITEKNGHQGCHNSDAVFQRVERAANSLPESFRCDGPQGRFPLT